MELQFAISFYLQIQQQQTPLLCVKTIMDCELNCQLRTTNLCEKNKIDKLLVNREDDIKLSQICAENQENCTSQFCDQTNDNGNDLVSMLILYRYTHAQ